MGPNCRTLGRPDGDLGPNWHRCFGGCLCLAKSCHFLFPRMLPRGSWASFWSPIGKTAFRSHGPQWWCHLASIPLSVSMLQDGDSKLFAKCYSGARERPSSRSRGFSSVLSIIACEIFETGFARIQVKEIIGSEGPAQHLQYSERERERGVPSRGPRVSPRGEAEVNRVHFFWVAGCC